MARDRAKLDPTQVEVQGEPPSLELQGDVVSPLSFSMEEPTTPPLTLANFLFCRILLKNLKTFIRLPNFPASLNRLPNRAHLGSEFLHFYSC